MSAGRWVGVCVLGFALARSAGAVDEDVARDLLTVITMEGLACGEVVEAVRKSDEDYTVTCKTGDRYRVHIVDERVRIEPLGSDAGDSPQG